MISLFGPDANRHVLLDCDRISSARQTWMMSMGKIFPNSQLLMDGDRHRDHRRIMQPTYRRPVLRQFVEGLLPMIEAAISRWGEGDGEVPAFPLSKELTLDMATSIFLGVDIGAGSRAMKTAFEDMLAASMSAIRLPIPGLEFHRGLKGRQYMLDRLGAMLEEKRSGDGTDMFSRLCLAEPETGESFDDQPILDHLIFLMMAAHDTTKSTSRR
jgi:cytochrome P450